MGTGSFPGAVAAGGVALNTHPHLAPRLKKEYSYTSTPPLGFRGLFWGKLYFIKYCHLCVYFCQNKMLFSLRFLLVLTVPKTITFIWFNVHDHVSCNIRQC